MSRPSLLSTRTLLLVALAACLLHLLVAANADAADAVADADAAVTAEAAPTETAVDASAISAVYNCSAPALSSDTLIDYKYLVHCTSGLKDSPVAARLVMLALLGVMLYLLSSTADSFFCPVLQAIVEKYRIPPDLAGVTFLTFGNGSPDVFSNIAAFTSASPSIGVTAILGGGLLVSTVIVACVGLVSEGQEQLIPRKYTRDVAFYFISVVYLGVIFFDGVVHMSEALGFLGIYCVFVLTVFLDKKLAPFCFPSCLDAQPDDFCLDHPGDTTNGFTSEEYMSVESPSLSESSFTEAGLHPHRDAGDINKAPQVNVPSSSRQLWKPTDYDVFRIPITSDSEQSEASPIPQRLARKRSAPTPRSELLKFRDDYHRAASAQEQQSLLDRTDLYLKRPISVCVSSIHDTRRKFRRRKNHTPWNAIESSAQLAANARRWTRSYHQLSRIAEASTFGEEADAEMDEMEALSDVEERQEEEKLPWETKSEDLFAENLSQPELSRWKRWPMLVLRAIYSAFDYYVWTPFEFTTVIIRRLSIPLVDEETWDKNFAIVCPPFAMLVFGTSVFQLSIGNPWFLGSIIVVGGFLGAIVDHTTSPLEPPSGWALAPYICVGFVMSVVWIMNIASELLGVLETLGELCGISNAVLGVSVLAWGNSIGDLVSNTSIARDGFPTMAFAGCFAGPMFNLLVGIGLSLTIAIASRGPISMGTPSPLIYLGFGYLLVSLMFNLTVCAVDKFRYRSALCYSLLILYASFAVISIVVVAADASE